MTLLLFGEFLMSSYVLCMLSYYVKLHDLSKFVYWATGCVTNTFQGVVLKYDGTALVLS